MLEKSMYNVKLCSCDPIAFSDCWCLSPLHVSEKGKTKVKQHLVNTSITSASITNR